MITPGVVKSMRSSISAFVTECVCAHTRGIRKEPLCTRPFGRLPQPRSPRPESSCGHQDLPSHPRKCNIRIDRGTVCNDQWYYTAVGKRPIMMHECV